MNSDNQLQTICHRLTRFSSVAVVCLLSTGFMTSHSFAADNNLQNISWRSLANQAVELRLQTTMEAPEPLSFTIDKPARISIDLDGTSVGDVERRQEFNSGPVRSLFVAEAGERTRIVLNLDTLVPHSMSTEGNDVIIVVGAEQVDQATTFDVADDGFASEQSTTVAARVRGIDQIDFRRGDNGSGRVIVDLTDPKTVVDIRQEGPQVIAEFKSTTINDDFLRRLDVTDFATPVNTIDTTREGNDISMVITAGDDYEQVAYQSDDVFTIEIKPYVATAEELLEAEREKKQYTGQKLSLNFQDIETRAVLQLLADVSGLNIVVSDTVVGNVTLRLQNVPWDQALDIVLKTKGLAMRQHENVVIVAPAVELANQEREELQALQQIEELAPLRSEFIQVNYAKAADLANLISQGADSTLLSDRGSVSVDDRTNTLLVQD
ncbi:MAG: AMIN domain-containing protein, partial [Gammaproteobacteria bacterium]|nr:AMIN domain-containing protein [Gammaproteobacteria bacterium]